MSDGEYLPAATARAERNLNAPIEDLLAEAKEVDTAAELMAEPDADDTDPNLLPNHLRDLHALRVNEGKGFYRMTTEAEHAALAPTPFDEKEDRTFAVVTRRSVGGLLRSYWCAPKATFDALLVQGEAPPEAHRLLGRFLPCRRL